MLVTGNSYKKGTLKIMKITPHQITEQFIKVEKRGWLKYFQTFARAGQTTTAHALGFGSRETNLENIKGDYRNGVWNGFGVMQVDIGTDPDYAKHWSKENVEHGITRGSDIYHSKTLQILNGQNKKNKVRNTTFIGRSIDSRDDLRRISTAAYNCGGWAYYHFSNNENVDSTTTGQDYSRDVYDRSIYFAALLEGKEIVIENNKLKLIDRSGAYKYIDGALYTELMQQGKYARPEHLALIKKQQTVFPPAMKTVQAKDDQVNIIKADYHSDRNSNFNVENASYEKPQTQEIFDSSSNQETQTEESSSPITNIINTGSSSEDIKEKVKEGIKESTAEIQKSAAPSEVIEISKTRISDTIGELPLGDVKLWLMTQFKARWVAITTAIGLFGTALYNWFINGGYSYVIIAVSLGVVVVIIYILSIVILKIFDRKNANNIASLNLQLQIQREQQAHELKLIEAKSAASRTQNQIKFVD